MWPPRRLLKQRIRLKIPSNIFNPQATHIFDGLEDWPTHVMYVSRGQLKVFAEASSLPALKEGRLLELVEQWLREDKAVSDAAKAAAKKEGNTPAAPALATWNNGWAAGRLASTIKHASNTVWRM